jgi:hypothetical protein
MKTKSLTGFVLISLLIFCIPKVNAFEYIDNIEDGISVYFLVSLDEGENLEVNITHSGTGNFTLFLFDFRPYTSHVDLDNKLNNEIYDVAINYSLSDNPYINYTISESHIYYIQILLIENGPDTFFLFCNHELTRYYLPIIPSYNVPLIIALISLIVPLILVSIKKKLRIKSLQ